MKTFRTLDLAINFYHQAKDLKLTNPMRDQYKRALLSIPLNLTEGNVKESAKERRKFFYTALGSFREVQVILKLSQSHQLLQLSDSLGAHLYKLCKSV